MAPPLDDWLADLGLETVSRTAALRDDALSRDVILDGERRFDLRVTIAWVAGMGLHLWGYHGPDAMELPGVPSCASSAPTPSSRS